jgi:hypothetical protein
MIQGQIEMWTATATKFSQSNSLRNLFFDLAKYEHNNGEGLDMIIAGLINQVSEQTNLGMESVGNWILLSGLARQRQICVKGGHGASLPGGNRKVWTRFGE